ncbi:MAG: hypothetical protein RLO18_25735 [Gimesia chilikensis]
MQKAVWITFGVSLVVINLVAELLAVYIGLYVPMFYRLVMVLSITVIALVFSGAITLVSKLEEEKPRSGYVSDTLGADRKPDDNGTPKNE